MKKVDIGQVSTSMENIRKEDHRAMEMCRRGVENQERKLQNHKPSDSIT